MGCKIFRSLIFTANKREKDAAIQSSRTNISKPTLEEKKVFMIPRKSVGVPSNNGYPPPLLFSEMLKLGKKNVFT